MKKFIYSFFLIILSLITFIIVYLSTVGLETSKFNNIIIKEIKKKDPNIQIVLNKIKIKFDLEKIQVYLYTFEPKITYRDIKIPITEINIYSKISSILKSKNEISQATVLLQDFYTEDIKKLAVRIKPSNFKTYLLNNLNNGKIEKILIEFKLDKDLNITDYKINGSIKKINIKIVNDLLIKEVSLNFISDKNLTLFNSVSANYNGISISNGSIDIKRNKEIKIDGKFNSQFNLNEYKVNKLFSKFNFSFIKKNKINAKGSLLHEFKLKIDENYKLIDYDYKSRGSILESQIVLKNSFKGSFLEKPIDKILISKTNLEINLNKTNSNLLTLDGLYSTDSLENKKFKITHNLKKNSKYLIDVDLSENIFLKLINFKTNSKNVSNIKSEFSILRSRFRNTA